MSFPFAQSPTLREYVDWCVMVGNCTEKRQISTDANGIPHPELVIDGPTGGWVVVVEPDFQERLAPSEVSRYDRRLGVVSPFPSAPSH